MNGAACFEQLRRFVPFLSFLFLIIVLQALNQLVKDHGNRAQNDDGCDDHIELEEIEGASKMDRHPIGLWR